jgi:hypothetical protein
LEKDYKLEHAIECYLKANKFLKAYLLVREKRKEWN